MRHEYTSKGVPLAKSFMKNVTIAPFPKDVPSMEAAKPQQGGMWPGDIERRLAILDEQIRRLRG